MDRQARIFVAGHRGLAGSAILRRLQAAGHDRLVTRSRAELDLTDAVAVDRFFAAEKPDYVFLAAAKVGGIHANSTYGGDFIRDNLLIQDAVINAAHRHGVAKLMFLGSSCIYPRLAPQPMKESDFMSGPLEPTNRPYAVAKIAGIELCRALRLQYGFDAISLMPTNLYGPGDNFDLENAHVLPALIHRFHNAKTAGDAEVTVWGSGKPRREFMHVDDLADAAYFLMQHYDEPDIINVGVGEDVSIGELAELVKQAVGFQGRLVLDSSKPDGMPRKLLDVSRLTALGWSPKTSLEDGIAGTYRWFLDNLGRIRR
ncbi:MAG: GDP-L-fucose synthase family protein [Alphaproteobacteria bacterium]